MTSTNIDVLAGHFGSFRTLAKAIGVSHTLLSRWKAKDGNVPPRFNDTIRAEARKLSIERTSGGEWDERRAKLFLGVVDNCLQDPVCETCGRAL